MKKTENEIAEETVEHKEGTADVSESDSSDISIDPTDTSLLSQDEIDRLVAKLRQAD